MSAEGRHLGSYQNCWQCHQQRKIHKFVLKILGSWNWCLKLNLLISNGLYVCILIRYILYYYWFETYLHSGCSHLIFEVVDDWKMSPLKGTWEKFNIFINTWWMVSFWYIRSEESKVNDTSAIWGLESKSSPR